MNPRRNQEDERLPNSCGQALLKVLNGVILLTVLLWVVLSLPSRAEAEQCDRTARREALRHKKVGWSLRSDEPVKAVSELEVAHKLCPDPWYLGNLALLYEKLGRIQDAIQSIDEYLENEKARQRKGALDGRRRLQALLVRAEITSEPTGAEISIDGEATGLTTPSVVELDPGEHRVELQLTDHSPAGQEFTGLPGEGFRLELTLEPDEPPPPPQPPPTAPPSSPQKRFQWTAGLQGGVGVALPVSSDQSIRTAFSLAVDLSGGIDFGMLRLELLTQLFVFPDTDGVVIEAGGGLRLDTKLGDLPLYVGIEGVIGLCHVSIRSSGLSIPEGGYNSLGVAPSLLVTWRVLELLEVVVRPLRVELMGLAGDRPGGFNVRIGFDFAARVRF